MMDQTELQHWDMQWDVRREGSLPPLVFINSRVDSIMHSMWQAGSDSLVCNMRSCTVMLIGQETVIAEKHSIFAS